MAGTTLRIVRANELAPGMRLVAVTELSIDYATLDVKQLHFLKAQFHGAGAIVTTEFGDQTLPIERLQVLDHLKGIVDIPGDLKVASVAPGMGPALARQGLLEFKVLAPAESTAGRLASEAGNKSAQRPAAGPTGPLAIGSPAAKERSETAKAEVLRFLEKLEAAAEDRGQASTMVEDMLDQGRKGNFSSKGVEAAVEDIVSKGSASAMKALAGLRGSDQTYAHCTDMSVILQETYSDILIFTDKEATASQRRFTLICGFMHDIGKSEVPKEILDSTQRFAPESREMSIMRNHTTYGARILSEMGMSSVAINVAHYHHVKQDTTLFTSYPGIPYDKVLPLTRLASIIDVYQALIGKRKYKRNWVPGKAVQYIMGLKGSEFDERMVELFVESMGIYPVGSLVRLSTNELAFVLKIGPREYPQRPIVAVVENAQGELLTHHSLLDLMLEDDISVEEVVDHYQHYSQSEEQAYQIFQSIRISP